MPVEVVRGAHCFGRIGICEASRSTRARNPMARPSPAARNRAEKFPLPAKIKVTLHVNGAARQLTVARRHEGALWAGAGGFDPSDAPLSCRTGGSAIGLSAADAWAVQEPLSAMRNHTSFFRRESSLSFLRECQVSGIRQSGCTRFRQSFTIGNKQPSFDEHASYKAQGRCHVQI
jgi:hypothetical protein